MRTTADLSIPYQAIPQPSMPRSAIAFHSTDYRARPFKDIARRALQNPTVASRSLPDLRGTLQVDDFELHDLKSSERWSEVSNADQLSCLGDDFVQE